MGKDYDVELLGSLPLDIKIREQADSGKPTVVADPDGARRRDLPADRAPRRGQDRREAAGPLGGVSEDRRPEHVTPVRFRFPVIIIDEDFRSENASGLGIRALAKAIEDEGMEVIGVTSYGDLSSFAQQQSRASRVHPLDRRRGARRRHAGGGRDDGRAAAQVREGDPLPQRRHPDLPVRRDAHLAAHPERHAARAARLHPHVRGHAGVRRALHRPRGEAPTSTASRRRSSARWSTTRRTARIRGTARATRAASRS